jgi:hypothetical protein
MSKHLTSKPRVLLGRDKELNNYIEDITKKTSNTPGNVIKNIHAITGTGKTWLIYSIFSRVPVEQEIAGLWIGFEPTAQLPTPPEDANIHELEPSETLPEYLFDTVVDRAVIDALKPFCTIHWRGPTSPPNESTFLAVFLDGLNLALLQHLTLPELPAMAARKPEPWEYLQENLIRPLVETGRALLFCTSQVVLRWNDWWLREQCVSLPMRQLDRAGTSALLEHYNLQNQEDLIFSLTSGHTASIVYLVQRHFDALLSHGEHSAEQQTPNATGNGLPLHQAQSVREQLEHLSPFARQVVGTVGLIRRVEVQPIMWLLQHLSDERPNLSNIHDVLSQCRALGLLENSPAFGPFSFLEPMRALIEYDLRIEDLSRYEQICALLQQWYKQQLQAKPLTKSYYLSEWMYFSLRRLLLLIAGEQQAMQGDLLDGWQRELRELWQRSGGHAQLERLQRDPQLPRLLRSVGLELGNDDAIVRLWKPLDEGQYRKELVDYLFEYYFPQPLTADDREVLVLLAQHVRNQPFNLTRLRNLLQSKRDKVFSVPTLQGYMARFSEVHAVTYDKDQGGFVMDNWLQQFLQEVQPQEGTE